MIQDNRPACWPAQFHPQPLPLRYCPDPTLAEQPLFEQARRGEAVAQLWQAPQGLVVPGSYRQFSELSAVSALFSRRGWPVWLRRSGGGLVPQGPGIINLSLAWPVTQPLGEAAEAYEVEIYTAGHATLKRTMTSATPSVTYTSAMQVADFGSNQAALAVKIYQISATVGRGAPLAVTV